MAVRTFVCALSIFSSAVSESSTGSEKSFTKPGLRSVKMTVASANQTEDCVDEYLSDLPLLFQFVQGNTKQGWPAGATVLGDRGELGQLKKTENYDYNLMNSRLVDAYDDILTECLTTTTYEKCSHNYTILIDVVDAGMMSDGATPCIEDCVYDRLEWEELEGVIERYLPASGIDVDWGSCKDPVSAAMVFAPPLIKNCLSKDYDCTEAGANHCRDNECYDCISTCLEGVWPKNSTKEQMDD